MPGLFFPKEQGGCELIPQLWGSWGREERSLPAPGSIRGKASSPGRDTAPGVGIFSLSSVWCVVLWKHPPLAKGRMENTRLK